MTKIQIAGDRVKGEPHSRKKPSYEKFGDTVFYWFRSYKYMYVIKYCIWRALCVYGLCGPPTRLAGSTWQMEHTENCNFYIRSINPLSYVPILPYPPSPPPLSYLSSITTCLCPPAPESIEGFIEDQAFLRSYDSAPRPPLPLPLPSASCLLPVCPGQAYKYTNEKGWRGQGGKPNHTSARKPGPL